MHEFVLPFSCIRLINMGLAAWAYFCPSAQPAASNPDARGCRALGLRAWFDSPYSYFVIHIMLLLGCHSNSAVDFVLV